MKSLMHALYALIVATLALFAYVIAELLLFAYNSALVLTPVLRVTSNSEVVIEIPPVEKYDRVYLVVDGRVNVDEIALYPVQAFQLPLRVETLDHDVFPTLINEKRYMFVVAERADKAYVKMRLQPITQYIIKSVEGVVKFSVLDNCEGGHLCIKLTPSKFHANNYTQTLLIYPIRQRAEPDFTVKGSVKVFDCRVDYINIVVLTEKNWYAYKIVDPFTPPRTPVQFEISAYTQDIYGNHGAFLGETLIGVAIGIGISNELYRECPELVVGIGEVVVVNSGEVQTIHPVAQTVFTFSPRIYVLRKYRPSINYVVSIASLTILLLSLTVLVVKIAKAK